MMMPCSTPKSTTPSVAVSERTKIALRTVKKATSALRSSSEKAAAITTAASAVWGRFLNSEGSSTSSATTTPAPTSPLTWVLAPDCVATAVRDPLTETAKPWKKPAARLAEPTPIISWLGSTSSPRRAAKLVEVAMVSVSDTSTMPSAAIVSVPRSPQPVQGNEGIGSPWGSEPTVFTPCSVRPSAAGGDRRADDRDQHRGHPGGQAWQQEQQPERGQTEYERDRRIGP